MSGSKRWVNRPEGSTWGDFGPDDQRGRINLRLRGHAVADVSGLSSAQQEDPAAG